VLDPRDLYHTGIIVTRLEEAAAEFTDATGVTWRPERRTTVRTTTGLGVLTVPFRILYSVQGPPFIELIEGIPGTVWSAQGGNRIHHLGYWAASVADESARLERLGMRREGGDGEPGGLPQNFSYHSTTGGIYVELISKAGRATRFPDVYPE
jgi:hypothetical protein